ncbi:RHS repeat-associated core domain-containing protein [Streptomyces pathocidini]|uniref:RHS repeat-associated core domain-containing protein n=2 Tax=Streptomyces pathocidini TaxID=1650571 RepID=A0ABW7UR83_9ACTN
MLYLPAGNELLLKADGKKAGTRYYEHNGETVAVRSGGETSFLISDHHGTATTAINAETLETQTRKMLPFGEDRGGTQPASWPGDKGFVGGTEDATGLTQLGARAYDPGIGRFISVDPMIDFGESQRTNPYAYANNNPVTFEDSDGLFFGWAKKVYKKAKKKVTKAVKKVKKVVKKAVKKVKRAVKKVAKVAKRVIKKAKRVVKRVAKAIAKRAYKAVKRTIKTVKRYASNVKRAANATYKATRSAVASSARKVSPGVREVKSGTSSVGRAMTSTGMARHCVILCRHIHSRAGQPARRTPGKRGLDVIANETRTPHVEPLGGLTCYPAKLSANDAEPYSNGRVLEVLAPESLSCRVDPSARRAGSERYGSKQDSSWRPDASQRQHSCCSTGNRAYLSEYVAVGASTTDWGSWSLADR